MKCEKLGNHTISYQSLLLSTTVLNDSLVFFYNSAIRMVHPEVLHLISNVQLVKRPFTMKLMTNTALSRSSLAVTHSSVRF